MSDITDAGGTALTPGGGGAGGGGLISLFIALGSAAQSAAVGVTELADAEAKSTAAKKQLIIDTQFLKDQIEGHTRAVADNSQAIQSAAYNTEVYSAAMQGNSVTTQDGIAVWGQATSAAMVIAAATAGATAALTDLLKAQNLYTASLQNTLSIATGWGDYLANLVQSYQSGTTSILGYKQALEQFLYTLETQFSTATGKAKAALDEMIATVQKLINTAGAGPLPSTDYGYGGVLNKQFNTPPAKP